MNFIELSQSLKGSIYRNQTSTSNNYPQKIAPYTFECLNDIDTKRSSPPTQLDANKDFIDSLQKRFQFQLQKEKQYYTLLINKLTQQIDFLQIQNSNLKRNYQNLKISTEKEINELKSIKTFQKLPINNNENFKSMLENLQSQHQNCIKIKKDLLTTIDTQQIKMKVLQEENKDLQLQLKQSKKLTQNFKQIERQNETYRKDIQNLKSEIKSLKSFNNLKQLQFNKQLSELQKQIQNLSIKSELQERRKLIESQQLLKNIEASPTIKYALKNKVQQFYQKPIKQKQIIESLYKKNLCYMGKEIQQQNRKQLRRENMKVAPKSTKKYNYSISRQSSHEVLRQIN